MLQRMRELTVQGANDTLVTEDRAALNAEMTQLGIQITDISDQTTFNTQHLLDGSVAQFTFQVGPDSSEFVTLTVADQDSTALGVNTLPISTDNANTWSDYLLTLDTAIESVSTTRSDLGAKQNRLEHVIRNLNVGSENAAASESRIRDADVAAEAVQLSRATILRQAGVSVLAQANSAPQLVMQLLR